MIRLEAMFGLGFASRSGMRKRYGFTILELAIFLMVLALLVGGILKWQDWSDHDVRPRPAQAR